MNVGDGKPGTGRDGSLPRAGAIKDRVNRAVGRLASLSRIENRMQLVGRPDQLGCLPLLTSEVAGRGRELWIWFILLAGGCPRGIGELVDELRHPGQLDLRNREHTRQCNVIKALMPLQAADRARHGHAADQPPWPAPPAIQAGLRRHRARRRPNWPMAGHSVMTTGAAWSLWGDPAGVRNAMITTRAVPALLPGPHRPVAQLPVTITNDFAGPLPATPIETAATRAHSPGLRSRFRHPNDPTRLHTYPRSLTL